MEQDLTNWPQDRGSE